MRPRLALGQLGVPVDTVHPACGSCLAGAAGSAEASHQRRRRNRSEPWKLHGMSSSSMRRRHHVLYHR
jgi:hypothetical protein